MNEHQIYFLTAQMYLAAAMAVEQMSLAAVSVGFLLGIISIWKNWRDV